jgi:hypothetical protein
LPPRRYYAIAAALVLLGITTAVLPTMLVVFNHPPSTQFVAPGTNELQIVEPGAYMLWHDYETVFEGRVYSSSTNSLPNGLEIRLRNKSTGQFVELRMNRTTYWSTGSTSRQSIGTFDVPTPGAYDLSVAGPATAFVVSFGKPWGLKLLAAIAIGGPIGALMAITGFVVGTTVLIKRHSRTSQ